MKSLCYFAYLINGFPPEYFIYTGFQYNEDCFIVSLQFLNIAIYSSELLMICEGNMLVKKNL